MNKIYPVYFTCANHFEELIVSLNSLRTICGDKIKDIYIYCDLEDYFSYDQINRLGNCIIKKTVAKMSWGGTKTIENELLAFFEISKEIDANDYIMNIDSDLVFVSSYVLDVVSKINNVDIIGQPLTHTFSPYWDKSVSSSPYTFIQGSCYFIKSSFVSSILKTYGRYRDDILSSVCSLCYVPVVAIPPDITISKIAELSKGIIKYLDFFVNRNQSVIHMELTKDSMWKPFGKMMGIKKVGYHNVLKSNKDKDEKKKFVIRRTGELGDVLLTTPIIKELSKRNPESEIHILTHYPAVFNNNPYVTSVNNDILTDNFIDLNGSYELKPNMHVTEAYSMDVLGDTNLSDNNIDLFPTVHDRASIIDWCHNNINYLKKTIVMHWKVNRFHMPKEAIDYLTKKLVNDFNVIVIGEGDDYIPNVNGIYNLYGFKLTLQKIKSLMDEADLFLGLDSGPMHIASASPVPMVILFTLTDYSLRMPLSKNNFVAILPDSKCSRIPCYHKFNRYTVEQPVNFNCPFNYSCAKKFDLNKVLDIIYKQIENKNQSKAIIASDSKSVSYDKKTKISVPKIVNIHRIDNKNIGDLNTSPIKYFNFNNALEIDIHDCYNNNIKGGNLIIGGGGLLNHNDYSASMSKILEHPTKAKICWGAGSNVHDRQEKETQFPLFLKKFDMVGVRDFNTEYEWVPCPSCMHNLFDIDYSIMNDFVIYEHAFNRINIEGPRLNNSCLNLNRVISFLASGKVVLTNTYHGLYWSILLKRKVIVINPWSSRFFGLKYDFPFATETNWNKKINETEIHVDALEECRERNVDFAKRVREIIKV